MFSFCQNKIISTGEGGAVVTDSKEIYEKMKLLKNFKDIMQKRQKNGVSIKRLRKILSCSWYKKSVNSREP